MTELCAAHRTESEDDLKALDGRLGELPILKDSLQPEYPNGIEGGPVLELCWRYRNIGKLPGRQSHSHRIKKPEGHGQRRIYPGRNRSCKENQKTFGGPKR
jgi:hypothetical protein